MVCTNYAFLKTCTNIVIICCTIAHSILTQVEQYQNNLISACLESSLTTIPRKNSSQKVIPGWYDIVEPERQKGILWNTIWLENGCPNSGIVADI